MLDRLEILINKSNINKIKNTKILIVGLGGVGGYALETIARSGIEHITLIEDDIIDITNLNRQLLTDTSNIKKYKTKIWQKHLKKINKNIKLTVINKRLLKDNISELLTTNYDFIIDTCDTIFNKYLLINYALTNDIKIISSLGTGRRMDATKLSITTLNKTVNDPIGKELRKLLRSNNLNTNITVISSSELPIKTKETTIGSNAFVPGVAGLLITNYIINNIVGDINGK